jgi:hypothetical protein
VDQGFAVVSQLDLLADYCEECGELFEIDLLEVYPEERAFQFSTCCEWSEACALDEVRGGSRSPFIRELFARYGIDVRQVYVDETGWLRLDYGLHLEPVDLKTAKAFVAKHHRHNRPPVGWKWGHAVYNGHELVAVAMVGRPVARMIDHKTTVEVNRVCVDPDLDKALVWNACSMLYARSAPRGPPPRLQDDRDLHARDRGRDHAQGRRLEARGAHQGRQLERAEPAAEGRRADRAKDPLGGPCVTLHCRAY